MKTTGHNTNTKCVMCNRSHRVAYVNKLTLRVQVVGK